jgi:septal ring factor EnvC (AmiA/AmiB activator)
MAASNSVQNRYQIIRDSLVANEQNMRATVQEIRSTVTELRQTRIQTDDDGWRAIQEMARLDNEITSMTEEASKRTGLLSKQLAHRSRTMLDLTRRTQINDENWRWILKLISLDALATSIERTANQIRDYIAGPQSVDGICRVSEQATRDTLEHTAKMDAIRAEL